MQKKNRQHKRNISNSIISLLVSDSKLPTVLISNKGKILASSKAFLDIFSNSAVKNIYTIMDARSVKLLQSKAFTRDNVDKSFRTQIAFLNNVAADSFQVEIFSAGDDTKLLIFRDNKVLQKKNNSTLQTDELEQLKQKFLQLASHQLLTPLTINNWYVELLLANKDQLSEEHIGYIEQIEKANSRLMKIIDKYLEITRIEAGNLTAKRQEFNIIELIDDIVGQVKKQLPQAIIETTKPATEILINSDLTILKTILEIFLENAVTYSFPEQIEIYISIEENENGLTISVEDKGIGIEAEAQQHIFKKFYRSAKALLHNTDGNGLGLYKADKLALLINSRIEVVPGKAQGSSFKLHLFY